MPKKVTQLQKDVLFAGLTEKQTAKEAVVTEAADSTEEVNLNTT